MTKAFKFVGKVVKENAHFKWQLWVSCEGMADTLYVSTKKNLSFLTYDVALADLHRNVETMAKQITEIFNVSDAEISFDSVEVDRSQKEQLERFIKIASSSTQPPEDVF